MLLYAIFLGLIAIKIKAGSELKITVIIKTKQLEVAIIKSGVAIERKNVFYATVDSLNP